jgi:hypothetical protein
MILGLLMVSILNTVIIVVITRPRRDEGVAPEETGEERPQ